MNIDIGNLEGLMLLVKNLDSSRKSYKHSIDQPKCDKWGAGFNKDSRFSSVKVSVSLDSWTGYYGNSGCSTAIRVGDREMFSKYFIKYLNNHFDEILDGVLDLAKKDATSLKEEALNALNKAKDEIEAF